MFASTMNSKPATTPINLSQSDGFHDEGQLATLQDVITACAGELLESHPHFRGRSRYVEIRCVGRRLILEGYLPSYYLKQLAQEAIRQINDAFEDVHIDNRIVVSSPIGEVDGRKSSRAIHDLQPFIREEDENDSIVEVKIESTRKRIPR